MPPHSVYTLILKQGTELQINKYQAGGLSRTLNAAGEIIPGFIRLETLHCKIRSVSLYQVHEGT